jgi:hypothetical protein
LKAYCRHLHETVWGQPSPPPPIAPPAAVSTPPKAKTTRKKSAPTVEPPPASVAPIADVPAVLETAASLSQTLGFQQINATDKQIYDYIQKSQGARLTEIQSALGINRSQTVDGLRALIKQGLITQRDRIYLVQEDVSL